MSAEQNCNDNTANQEDELLVSPAVPFWMRVLVKPETSALSPEVVSTETPDRELEGAPDSDETYAILMRAIQGTEIARRLGGLAPKSNRTFQAPAPTGLPADAADAANSDTPIAGTGRPAATPAKPASFTPPQPNAIDEPQENEEICTNLLRAIEGTNIARQLGAVAPMENGCAPEPAPVEAPEAVAECATVEAVCATPLPAATPEVAPADDSAPLLLAEVGDVRENGEIAATTLQETAGSEIAANQDVAPSTESLHEPESAQPAEVDAAIAAMEPSAAEAMNKEQAADATPLPLDLSAARECDETCATTLPITEDTEIAAIAEVLTPAESGLEAEPAQPVEMDAASAAVAPPDASELSEAAVGAEPTADATPRPLTRRAGAGARRQAASRPRRRKITERDTRRKRAPEKNPGVAAAAPPPPMELLQEAAALSDLGSAILPTQEPTESTCQPEPAERPAELEPVLAADAISNPTPEPAVAIPDPLSAAEVSEPVAAAEVSEPVAAAEVSEPATAAEVSEPVAAAEVSEPATAAEVSEPVAAAEVSEPATAAEVSEPAATIDLSESAPEVVSSSTPEVVKDESQKPPVLARLGAGINRVAFRQPGDYLDRAEMHLESWFLKWFDPPDPRRRSARLAAPPLAAYHWTMDVPQGLKIANISAGGMCLVTDERWTDGVIVSLTLQRTDMPKGSAESWIAVDFVVTRWCEDGIAGAFIPSRPGQLDAVAGRAMNCADKKTLERFMAQLATPARMEMGKEGSAI